MFKGEDKKFLDSKFLTKITILLHKFINLNLSNIFSYFEINHVTTSTGNCQKPLKITTFWYVITSLHCEFFLTTFNNR